MSATANIFLANDAVTSTTPYTIANNNTAISGGSNNDYISILTDVTGIVVSSTIENITLNNRLQDYKFKQGFGSNIEIYDSSDILIVSQTDVDGTNLTFSDGTIDLAYNTTNNIISIGTVDITTTADFLNITSPTMISAIASTDGVSVVITYDENLIESLYTDDSTDYALTLSNGSLINVVDMATLGNTATLTLNKPITNSTTISSIAYDYDANTAGTIRGLSILTSSEAQDQVLTTNIINNSTVIDETLPIFTSLNAPVTLQDEDTQITITFEDIHNKSDAVDETSIISGYKVVSLTKGTLTIDNVDFADANTQTPNNIITLNSLVQWTPDTDDNGTNVDAFKIVAMDSAGNESVTPIQVQVNVTPVVDAPTLQIITTAGDSTHKTNFTITSEPDTDERIALTFENLATNMSIVDSSGVDVTSGILNFNTTQEFTAQEFTAIVPQDEDFNNNISVKVTSYDDSDTEMAQTSQDISIAYEISSSTQTLNFSSSGQSIWDTTAPEPIGWHKYIPIIGDVAQTWNEDTKEWDSVDGAAWSSGDMNIVDVDIDVAVLTTEITRYANAIFNDAQSTFDTASVAVDETALATFNNAKTTFEGALQSVDSGVQTAFDNAKDAFNSAEDTYNNAQSTFNSIKNNFLGPQTDLLDTIRQTKTNAWYEYVDSKEDWLDSAYTVFGITYRSPTKYAIKVADYATYKAARLVYDAALLTYDAQESVYESAKNVWDDAKDAFEITATDTFNGAKSTYETAIETSNSVALSALKTAETTYDTVKQGIFDAAKAVLDVAQGAFNSTMDFLDNTTFDNKLQLNAKLDALIGFQVDFVLDFGSVDTNLNYTLTSSNQYNKTTDTLTITPTMTNATTGDSVAYSTLSPNTHLTVTLVSDVDVSIDTFADGSLVVSGNTIFDISPDTEGLSSSSTLTTNFSTDSDVSKFVLFHYDSLEAEPFEVPGLDVVTKGVATLELSIPNVATDGLESSYNQSYFDEGNLVNADFSEIGNTIVDLVTAQIDYSDELKAQYSDEGNALPEISTETIASSVQEIFRDYILDLTDGKTDAIPIFVIDNTDESDNSFLHINSISDDLSTLGENTSEFGFYTSYGESENSLAKITVDIDQLAAVIINDAAKTAATAASVGTGAAILATPVVNLMDLSLELEDFFKKDTTTNTTTPTDAPTDSPTQAPTQAPTDAPTDTPTQAPTDAPEVEIPAYAENFDINGTFETADIDVSEDVSFSQKFSLSIDDMSYLITLEDGSTQSFKASDNDSITINNISTLDNNNDGKVEYTIDIVPTAMFSNDTELNLGLGYSLNFLQGSLSAGFNIPILDYFGENVLPDANVDLSFLDINFGPLLSIEGELDALDIDVFENRFEIGVGSSTSNLQFVGITDDTMFIT